MICDFITSSFRRIGATAFVLSLFAADGATASDGPIWLSDWVSPVFGSEAIRQRDPRESRGMTAEERRERSREAAMRAETPAAQMPTSINSSVNQDRFLWVFRGNDPGTAKPVPLAGMTGHLLGEDGSALPIGHLAGTPPHMAVFRLEEAGNYAAYLRQSRIADGMREVDIARAQIVFSQRLEKRDPDPAARPPVFDDTAELDLTRERLSGEKAYTRLTPGNRVVFTVRSRGEPAAGVPVTLVTQKGWRKTERSDAAGHAVFTLIREDFPSWTSILRRSSWSTWLAVAERIDPAPGVENGVSFERTRLRATLAGRTYPAPSDYRSQAIGLGIIGAVTALCGIGIFLYRERRARPFREIRFDEHA